MTIPTAAAVLAFALALGAPAWADPWKDESGHGRSAYGYGDCEYELEIDEGKYKEKVKCKGDKHRRGYVVPAPVGVYIGGLPVAVGPVPDLPGLACNRDLIGGVLGGAAGGVLGSQVGKGDTRTAATIGGTIIGVLVGGSIGRAMDQIDQACVGQALEYAPSDRPVVWHNPDGGSYELTPLRTFEHDGTFCREYRTDAVINSQARQAVGTACRTPDGAWRLVD